MVCEDENTSECAGRETFNSNHELPQDFRGLIRPVVIFAVPELQEFKASSRAGFQYRVSHPNPNMADKTSPPSWFTEDQTI